MLSDREAIRVAQIWQWRTGPLAEFVQTGAIRQGVVAEIKECSQANSRTLDRGLIPNTSYTTIQVSLKRLTDYMESKGTRERQENWPGSR